MRQHHEIWILNFVVVQTYNVFVSYIPLSTVFSFALREQSLLMPGGGGGRYF